MNTLDRLTEYFSKFPGIGPRQASRFVFSLLRRNPAFRKELADLILRLGDDVIQCRDCYRYFTKGYTSDICHVCNNTDRDSSTLMVVEKDADLENVERSGTYSGRYFVLGGTIPVLEKDPASKIRIKELLRHLQNQGVVEIIIALSVTPQGEQTRLYVQKELQSAQNGIKITTLGRGVSTGSELEYIDSETILSALSSRS